VGLVYSTGGGRVRSCPHCGKALQDGRCNCRSAARPAGDGILRVRRETGGRRGKTVTTIAGFAGSDAELRALAGQLKKLCATGGSVTDGVIEVQGDHRERVVGHLRGAGHQVKLAGG
jgi:translation initiation factor 1